MGKRYERRETGPTVGQLLCKAHVCAAPFISIWEGYFDNFRKDEVRYLRDMLCEGIVLSFIK